MLSAVLCESYCASAFCLTLSTHSSDILLNSRMKNDRVLYWYAIRSFVPKSLQWIVSLDAFPFGREGTVGGTSDAAPRESSSTGAIQASDRFSLQVRSRQSLLAPFALRVRVRSSVAVVHFLWPCFQMSNKETAIEDFKASGLWSRGFSAQHNECQLKHFIKKESTNCEKLPSTHGPLWTILS